MNTANLVKSVRVGGKVKQMFIRYLGKVDEGDKKGRIESLEILISADPPRNHSISAGLEYPLSSAH